MIPCRSNYYWPCWRPLCLFMGGNLDVKWDKINTPDEHIRTHMLYMWEIEREREIYICMYMEEISSYCT